MTSPRFNPSPPSLDQEIIINGHKRPAPQWKEIPLVSGSPDSLSAGRSWYYLVLAFLGYIIIQLFYRDYLIDDAFIHLTFARNIIDGKGFTFNGGEPTYGVTAPLWTLLLAGAGKVVGVDPLMVKVLSGLLGGLTIVFWFRLARGVGLSPYWSSLGAMIWGFNAFLGRWSASGMETPLALLLLILAFDAQWRERWGLAGIWCGLATLTRPEVFGLGVLFSFEALTRRNRKGAVVLFSLFLLSLMPWYLYAYFTFHTLTPNPALIKMNVGVASLADLAVNLYRTTGVLFLGNGVEIVIAGAGVIVLLTRRGGVNPWWGRLVALLIVWALFPPVFFLVKGVFVQSRYLLLSFPPILLGAMLVLQAISQHFPSRMAHRWAIGLVSLLVVWQLMVTQFMLLPHIERFKVTMNVLRDFGQELQSSTPQNTLVAVGDVGAVGYYSARPILDLEGLVTRSIIPLRQSHSYDELVEKELFFLVDKPQYLIDKSPQPLRMLFINPQRYKVVDAKVIPRAMVGERPEPIYYVLYQIVD